MRAGTHPGSSEVLVGHGKRQLGVRAESVQWVGRSSDGPLCSCQYTRPQSTRPVMVPLTSAPFCPQPPALSAGNNSSQTKGKQAGLACALTKPSPFTPLQRVGRDWPERWVQDDIKLGEVGKLADALADKVGRV